MVTVANSKQTAQQFESVNSKSVRSHLHSSIMVSKTNTSKVGPQGTPLNTAVVGMLLQMLTSATLH